MKCLIFLFVFILLSNCTNNKTVYWCGDHACINKKEKKAYFKKTMIVEIRELNPKTKNDKSELDIIKERAGLGEKKVKKEKDLIKLARKEEKRRIKEEKELVKQLSKDEKKRIKEEKKLAKQALKEEKKLSKKKSKKLNKKKSEKQIVASVAGSKIEISEFKTWLERITKKNSFRPFPDINDIPN
jgi:chromatin assembly factor 1 subunit A